MMSAPVPPDDRTTDYNLSINGLRGFLAFGVFLHHAILYRWYLLDGVWRFDASRIVAHLGSTSVTLFFMVTGFLFWSKVLNARAAAKPIDWGRLLLGRVFRLGPLYWTACLICFSIAAWVTGFRLLEPVGIIAREAANWLLFTVPGKNSVNHFSGMGLVIGIAWTLTYEWLFYFSLPLLSDLARRRVTTFSLLAACGAASIFYLTRLESIYLLAFAGGMISAHLARWPAFRRRAVGVPASFAALLLLTLDVAAGQTAYNPASIAALTGFFAIISSGNTLFTILARPFAQFLGTISYGIYLLHLPLFFILFILILGPVSAQLSTIHYCLVILALGACVIGISWLAWIGIESPALKWFRSLRAKPSTTRANAP